LSCALHDKAKEQAEKDREQKKQKENDRDQQGKKPQGSMVKKSQRGTNTGRAVNFFQKWQRQHLVNSIHAWGLPTWGEKTLKIEGQRKN